jgi:hypothetical protein
MPDRHDRDLHRRLFLALVAVVACSRGSAPPHAAPLGSPGLALPDATGFAAEPPVPGDGFVRRTYARGGARIQVTLARMPMTADDYQRWVVGSAAFPQADLGVPASDANGFYQCADAQPPSCDLLLQLRAGYHLELRGGGSSSRADVDALARALPLRGWISETGG